MLDLRALGTFLVRIAIAAALAGAVAAVVVGLLFGVPDLGAGVDDSPGSKVRALAQGVVGTLVGGAAYAAATWLLGIRELRTIVAILADLIRRRGRS